MSDGFSGSPLLALAPILPVPTAGEAGYVLQAIGAGMAGWSAVTSIVTDSVKNSNNDTTAGYLSQKLISGAGILLTTLSPGGNEALKVINSDTGSAAVAAHLLAVTHLTLGTASTNAFRGDYGNAAYLHSQIVSGNPHGTTATDVGLGQVNNTSDINKPLSNASIAALKLLQAGPATVATVTDHGNGLVDISACTVRFNTVADWSGSYTELAVPAITGLQLAANTYTYIVAEYNNGSPLVTSVTDLSSVNQSTVINTAQLYWENINSINRLHQFSTGDFGLGLANKVARRLIHVNRFAWETGLTLGEAGTRNLTISAGTVWYDGESFSPSAVNTGVSGQETTFYYHVSGVWNAATASQYGNLNYDNGTNLLPVTSGNYVVNWVYRCVDVASTISFIIMGGGDYNLTQAAASLPPIMLPDVVSKQAFLVGRIIALKGASSATRIDSSFATAFASSPIFNHNDLSLIQGGAAGDYQHLTTAQVTALHPAVSLGTANGLSLAAGQVLSMGLATGSLAGALSAADWTTFNAKQNTVLTGLSAASGAIVATDTVLQAFGKLSNVAPADASNIALNSNFAAISMLGASNELKIGAYVAASQHGVETASAIALSFVNGTKTLTASPTATNYRVWYSGKPITISSNLTWTIASPFTAGIYYCSLDSTGAAQISNTVWDLSRVIPINIIYWDGTKGVLFEERHGITQDWATHLYLHSTIGTRYVSGLNVSGYATGSYTDNAVNVDISSGVITDEDLRTATSDTGVPGLMNIWYQQPGGSAWTWDAASTTQIKNVLGVPQLNVSGTQTAVVSGNFFNSWIFAIPALSGSQQIVVIQAQNQFTTLAAAEAETISGLNVADFPFVECLPVCRITYQYTASGGGTANCQIPVGATPLDLRGVRAPTGSGAVSNQHSALSGRSDIGSHPSTALSVATSGFTGVLNNSAYNTVQLVFAAIDTMTATTFTKGFLSASDWNTFNSKQNTISINATPNGLSIASSVITLLAATSSQTGALTSTDWNTFNNKQSTITIGATPNGLSLLSNVLSINTATSSQTGALTSTDWSHFNTAYTSYLQWDGGPTNLVAATGRSSLGLGSAAVLTAGTAANNAVQLDGSAHLPAVDGSALTNLTAANVLWNVRTITSAPTISATDYTLLCNATSAGFTVTLPASASSTKRVFVIKKIDTSSNLVTIQGNASELIDAANTYTINTNYNSITIQCDGAQWWII